jgi:hypothetical protein
METKKEEEETFANSLVNKEAPNITRNRALYEVRRPSIYDHWKKLLAVIQ